MRKNYNKNIKNKIKIINNIDYFKIQKNLEEYLFKNINNFLDNDNKLNLSKKLDKINEVIGLICYYYSIGHYNLLEKNLKEYKDENNIDNNIIFIALEITNFKQFEKIKEKYKNFKETL